MKLTSEDGKSPAIIDRSLTLELVRVTERAAIAAAGWRGKGDEKAADHAAVEAMRTELGNVRIDGRIVIGEGERDEAPMLFIGEEVGGKDGPAVDIAVDPLEGTTLCAKNQPDSICVLAMAERGGLLNAPDVYMQKIAIGSGYAEGTVDLDMNARENIESLARAKGVPVIYGDAANPVDAVVRGVAPAGDRDRGTIEIRVPVGLSIGWRAGATGEASVELRRSTMLMAIWWNLRQKIRNDLFI